MIDVLKGEDVMKTGTKIFPEGSFANGGAMRISPIGIAFRNATDNERHEAVRLAIISSHVHPQAVDGAWLIASAISKLASQTPNTYSPMEFLTYITSISRDEVMKARLGVVRDLVQRHLNHSSDSEKGEKQQEEQGEGDSKPKEDSEAPSIFQVGLLLGDEFQIKAVDAVACSVYSICTNWHSPENCLIKAVAMGGDTDTVAAIAGSVMGALHGTRWIPDRWYEELENGARGRDWVIDTAKKLAKLDLHDVKHASQEEIAEMEKESAQIEVAVDTGCATQ